MANEDLVNYIKTQKVSGTSDETIKSSLLANGWGEEVVQEAFDAPSVPAPSVPVPTTGEDQGVPMNQNLGFPTFGSQLKNSWNNFKERKIMFLIIFAIPAFISVLEYFILGSDFSLISSFFLWISGIAMLFSLGNRNILSAKEAYGKGFKKFFPYIWVGFLAGMAVFGGFLMFIIPGIIFAFWISQAETIVILEDVRGFTALQKSREYVRGRIGKIFWRNIAFFCLILIFILPVILIDGFIALSNDFWANSVRIVVGAIITMIAYPMAYCFQYEMYKDLKNDKSGLDFHPKKKEKDILYWSILVLPILILIGILLTIVFGAISGSS